MSVNPDNDDYIGLGPQSKDTCTDLDQRFLIPNIGMLRFVERDGKKILQQYQWSAEVGDHGWYDIPLADLLT